MNTSVINRTSRADSQDKGFSLVELLMVLGLTGIVAAAVFMAYYSGAKAWHRAENQVEVQQNLRIAMDTLSTEVRRADYFGIAPGQREIMLVYADGTTKAYKFHPASGEIRISQSGATVAMHIENLRFTCDNNLLTIEITTKGMEGIEQKKYSFSINIRGKIYEH
jgi:prepilin-type N-terminal cleavage/methylation domain-containing protein